jgi:hypothetical protein
MDIVITRNEKEPVWKTNEKIFKKGFSLKVSTDTHTNGPKDSSLLEIST